MDDDDNSSDEEELEESGNYFDSDWSDADLLLNPSDPLPNSNQS